MKTLMTQIKNAVPKGMKVAAVLVFAVALTCAVVFAFMSGVADGRVTRTEMPAPIAMGIALFVGTLGSAWLLLIGFIYADSKRRGMPPLLWVLVSIMVPNMVGIILYFALRKPMLSACFNCGQAVAPGQKFCPSCGREQNSPPSSNASSSMQPGSMPLSQKQNTVAQKSYAIGLFVWTGIFLAKAALMYWKHQTAEASGLLVLAMVCGLLATAVGRQKLARQHQSQTSSM